MDRVVGIETEYGCLLSEDEPHVNSELWPAKVKNHLFRDAEVGTIDLHYRDYEEPPGNGGFLLNGGRLYLDMGHIEYASPECLHLHDLVTYDVAGDELLQSSLVALEAEGRVAFIKNNVDHQTGATFGCHENYLMKREAQFTPPILGTLLAFLATRQIFTGAGRVGQANPLAFDFEPPQQETPVNFQLTSATVWNVFWVPQMGTMIYTMPRMTTRLNLQADKQGKYLGFSAHFSGDGFADMRFDPVAVPPAQFAHWAAGVKGAVLDRAAINQLLKQRRAVRPYTYRGVDPQLFDAIAAQKLPPGEGPQSGRGGPGTENVMPHGGAP